MFRNQEGKMKLAVITNPYTVKSEISLINQMFSEGLDELHIRKPKFEEKDMKKFIDQIDADYHDKLVLHAHFPLVTRYDIRKIHLAHDRIDNVITNLYLDKVILKGKKVTKSMTITNGKSLYKPVESVDEFLLGPVFARFTYMTNNQLMKTADLEKALRHSKLPVIALGGVSSQTLEFFKQVGFRGVAMQSSLWKSVDPMASFIEVRDHSIATEHRLRIAV